MGHKAQLLLALTPGQGYMFDMNADIPFRTCARHGVVLSQRRSKILGVKFIYRKA